VPMLAFGEDDGQGAGRSGGERGEALHGGEGAEEAAVPDDLDSFTGLSEPVELRRGGLLGGDGKADEDSGRDEERGGVDGERDGRAGPGCPVSRILLRFRA
jgi:hypothetical protein